MTKIPSRVPNSDDSSRVSAERRKVRRRPHQAASAALLVAQNYAGVGLLVFALWPGDKWPNSPRQGNATTGALCCEIEEHQMSTTITRERLHGVAAWVDSRGYNYAPAPEALTDAAAQLRLDAEQLLETPGVGQAAWELCLDELELVLN